MTNEYSSLEKIYLSHFIIERVAKGLMLVMCERWVGDRTDCNILTPIPLTIAALLPHSARQLNRGPEGPNPLFEAGSPCLELQFELQLTQTVFGTWLYYCITLTCFVWASQLHRIQLVHRSRWYPDIFDRMHLLFTQVHLLIDSSVEGQYFTVLHHQYVVSCSWLVKCMYNADDMKT